MPSSSAGRATAAASSSAATALDLDAIYALLIRRLAESGEWDRIRSVLNCKLSESGWTDDLRHRSREHALAVTEPLPFRTLLEELGTSVHASVPLAVQREVSGTIRAYLEKQLE